MSRSPKSPAPVEPFSRPCPVAELGRDEPTPFRIAADSSERAALARHLDVVRVDRLSFEGQIAPAAAGGFLVEGRLTADVVQTCVVTLEPLAASHDMQLSRLFVPASRLDELLAATVSSEGEVEADADEPDGYTDTIDLGALATESLLLALEPYPRREGVELGEIRAAPPGAAWDEAEGHPFARLAELRARLRNGGD